jgi:glycine cleavage system H protein
MELLEDPNEFRYAPNHMWVRTEGSRAIIGLTDYGQMEFGMLLFVELPELKAIIQAGESPISIETVDREEELTFPVSGTITAINTALYKEPSIVNLSPYALGWLVVIEMSNPVDLDQLWDQQRYQEYCGQ